MHCRQLLQGMLLSVVATTLLTAQAPAAQPQPTPEALSAAYTQAMQARDWQGAIAAAQKLIDLGPTAEHIRMLGAAQINANDSQTALATFDRALAAAETEKPAAGQPDAAWKDDISQIYFWKGNALLKLHRNMEAVDAFTRSAELTSDPAKPYFNICAVLYNVGDTQNALPACRKAVIVGPTNANAWFVLGSLLFVDAKTDDHGNFVITPECRQALQKYLELAPDGPHAADVKAMLQMAAK
jgi:tetratricopeptide (TPR) repeat protein